MSHRASGSRGKSKKAVIRKDSRSPASVELDKVPRDRRGWIVAPQTPPPNVAGGKKKTGR
jgi:hypothetical protein